MTPFLARRDGAPYLAVGAPGGRKIVTAVPQVLSNLTDARPQGIRVTGEGLVAGVDHLRPATAMGF